MLKFIATNSTGIRETFGKFGSILSPGLNIFIPCVQSVHEVSNRIHEDTHVFEIKTKDNVFTKIQIQLQTQVSPHDTYNAFYNWSNPHSQMRSYINDIVRSTVPTLTLDELYASSNDISDKIMQSLTEPFKKNGYTIIKALVGAIEPASSVKDAMNAINASERNKIAAQNNADANYIMAIKEAESEKVKKKLIGEGIADQRKAIMQGYREGLSEMSDELDVTPRELLRFIKDVQTLEMQGDVAKSNNTKVVFLPAANNNGKEPDINFMAALEAK